MTATTIFEGWYPPRGSRSSPWLLTTTTCLSLATGLLGLLNVFSLWRPHDVHWHFVLLLDATNFILGIVPAAVSNILNFCAYG